MAENDDHRIVSREDADGTRHTALVRRSPETDQLSDGEIIASLEAWRAQRQQPDHERWPMPSPFGEWIMATEPGPQERCPECGCWSLRTCTAPDNPAGEKKVVCTMTRCEASPFYRDQPSES